MQARYMLSSFIRLSVRLSVTSRYCNKTTGRIELLFLAWRLPSTYSRLWGNLGVSPDIRVLRFGTLSQTFDLENFATASRSHCQQNSSSSSSSTVELVDNTYTTVDESWVDTTSRSAVALQLYLLLLLTRCWLKAKFNYTGPTGPDPHGLCPRPAQTNGVSRRSWSFGSVLVRAGRVGSGRARVVEFSYNVARRAELLVERWPRLHFYTALRSPLSLLQDRV